jgi:hypothetical protein
LGWFIFLFFARGAFQISVITFVGASGACSQLPALPLKRSAQNTRRLTILSAFTSKSSQAHAKTEARIYKSRAAKHKAHVILWASTDDDGIAGAAPSWEIWLAAVTQPSEESESGPKTQLLAGNGVKFEEIAGLVEESERMSDVRPAPSSHPVRVRWLSLRGSSNGSISQGDARQIAGGDVCRLDSFRFLATTALDRVNARLIGPSITLTKDGRIKGLESRLILEAALAQLLCNKQID